MYNKVFLIGRLTKDPEMRVTLSGISVTRFTIAIDRIPRKNQQQKTTDFLRIVSWRRLAEICGEYLKKGKLVAVEGRLQFDNYEVEGESRQSVEIVADNVQMLDRINESTRTNSEEMEYS
jgi:single-strand DNA-binding protein